MSLTYTESRERARLLSVTHYDLHLTLSQEQTFDVAAVVEFTCSQPGAGSFIDLVNPVSVTATLNGEPVHHRGDRIELPNLAATNTLVVAAVMPTVTGGDGMQRFVDPLDGAVYVSAYCGMDVACRIFPCFDQPDLKAPLTIAVDAPHEWTVLSNGVGNMDGTTHRFTTTPPISTYLFVVCAGTWHSMTWEHAGLPFGWHIRASLAERLDRDAAELRRITEQCFDYYTSAFNAPFPFDSYDQVLVPQHNWGALETPGCVTFREEFLTAGAPTALQRQGLASVIAHEMAHMWFGNLVTMVWWQDSWLNESFADFMGYDVAGRAAGFTDVWAGCALGRKVSGYRADERGSTHPIAEDADAVVDVDTAFSNFDMITYAKGNAVLRQLGAWLGEEEFAAATNRHLDAHAFGNAALADYLSAMNGTGRDVDAWAGAWLRRSGFDTIVVERAADGVPVLRREGSRPHRFTVAIIDGEQVHTEWVDLADEPVRLPQATGLAVIANAGDETFARLRLDELSWNWVRDHLGSVESSLTRALLWATAVDLARSGSMPATELVAMAAKQLPAEPSPTVFEGVLALLEQFTDSAFVEPDAGLLEPLAQVCRDVLAESAGSDHKLAATRALANLSTDSGELTAMLGDAVDQDLRWRLVRRLVELGDDVDLVDEELRRDRSSVGQLGASTARAAACDAEVKQDALEQLLDGDASNREWTAITAGLFRAGQHEVWLPLLPRLLEAAPTIATERGQGIARLVGAAFPNKPLPTAQLRECIELLSGALQGEVPSVLRRAWQDVLDDLRKAAAAR